MSTSEHLVVRDQHSSASLPLQLTINYRPLLTTHRLPLTLLAPTAGGDDGTDTVSAVNSGTQTQSALFHDAEGEALLLSLHS